MATADGFERERLIDIRGWAWRWRCSQAARWRSAWAVVGTALLLVPPLVVFQLGRKALAPSSADTTGTLQQSESALLRGELLCRQAHDERECDRIGCCTFNKQSSVCESAVGNSPCHQGSSVEVGVEWVLSEQGANCRDTCDGKGLQCNQHALTRVETEEQVIDIARKAGHKCLNSAAWSYPTNPGICTSARCCGGKCKGICAYGGAAPGQLCGESLPDYSRLCPCSKKSARWVLGAELSSCSETCKKLGATCDEEALKAVDTADEVMGVAKAAGTECASRIGATVGWAYDSNPGVCTNKHCCLDGSCTGICAFGKTGKGDCSSEYGDYSRLCPCTGGTSDGGSPAPPPPPKQAEVERVSLPAWHWMSGIEGMESSAGFSWYTRIFTLLQEPPMDWQMGTAGSWMTPTSIDFDVCACDPKGWPSNTEGDPSYGCCESSSKCSWLYSTIEGGPGYWSGSQLPTRTMKWRIVVTTACYEKGGQTPLFFYGGQLMSCKDMGVVQLSNRMLLAPDGIAFSRQGLFGVGFVRTPLGKVSADDDRNFWTFVVDAENFAGPVAYFLPEMFGERPAKWRVQSAHLKDFGTPGVGISNGGGFGFEWNTLFSYKQGDFIKIPQMAVPVSHGRSVLAMNGRGYEDADVYDPLEEALSKHQQIHPADIMARGTPFGCNTMQRDATFRVSEDKTAVLGKLRTEKGKDGCVWSLATDNSSGYFPRYFRASDMQPVDEAAAPRGLQAQAFPKKGSLWPKETPYSALGAPPNAGLACWASPGPADDALYCAQTSSPSWVAYRWYQFVDQPGLQRLGLSKAEKAFMQSRVEALHRTLRGRDRWMKAGAAADGGLAEVSGAQLVSPPAHLQFGYVPIAVYEGTEKPSGCKS